MLSEAEDCLSYLTWRSRLSSVFTQHLITEEIPQCALKEFHKHLNFVDILAPKIE